jgi:REP element-mobilizing transposase RayT
VRIERRRRSIRLAHWDYSECGAYFVTICTHGREPLLGEIVSDQVVLNPLGRIVEDVWRSVVGAPRSEGEFIVMPNHVHGIVWIDRVGVEQLAVGPRDLGHGQSDLPFNCAPVAQPLRFDDRRLRRGLRDGLEPGSFFVILRTFKSAAAKCINRLCGTPGGRVWQRDYYERVLRNDGELDAARRYILDNPRKWAEDKHNPAVSRRG